MLLIIRKLLNTSLEVCFTSLAISGAVMAELAEQLLGVRDSGFSPTHRGNLANEFKCFTNYDSPLSQD